MGSFLSRIKDRWELYLFFVMGAGAIFMKVWGVGDEVQLIQRDVSQVKSVQTQLVENKIDSDLLDAKLQPLLDSTHELKRELEITQQNVSGLRVESLAGAEERSEQLEGRLIVVQNMVYNNSITAQAAVESLSVLSKDVAILKQTAKIDTVTFTRADTVDAVKVEPDAKWWNPFD